MKTLRAETVNGVRHLVLCRAAEYNTITPALRDELAAAIDAADDDRDVHVILLRAEGPAFCAGYGLDWSTAAEAQQVVYDAADQSGIIDRTDITTNGGVTYSVDTLDISTLTDSAADLADLEQMIGWVDTAISDMTTSASNLGAVKQRVTLQQDFVKALMDAVTRGIGTLVDADMNEEATKLQALQVQQ